MREGHIWRKVPFPQDISIPFIHFWVRTIKAEPNIFVIRDASEDLSGGKEVSCFLSQLRDLSTSHRSKSCSVSQSSLPPWPTLSSLSPTPAQSGSGRVRVAPSMGQQNQSVHRKVSALYTINLSPIVLIHNTRTSHSLNSCYVNLGRIEHMRLPKWSTPGQGRACSTHLPQQRFIYLFWKGVGNIRRAKGKNEDSWKARD